MRRFPLWRAVAGAATLVIAFVLVVAARDNSSRTPAVQAPPIAHVHSEGEGLRPEPGALTLDANHPLTAKVSQLPVPRTTQGGDRNSTHLPTGAFNGTLVPAGFPGVPANTPAVYNGAPMELRVTYI